MTVFISIKPYRTPSFVLSSIYSNPWVMGDVVKFFIYYLSSVSIIKVITDVSVRLSYTKSPLRIIFSRNRCLWVYDKDFIVSKAVELIHEEINAVF